MLNILKQRQNKIRKDKIARRKQEKWIKTTKSNTKISQHKTYEKHQKNKKKKKKNQQNKTKTKKFRRTTTTTKTKKEENFSHASKCGAET